MSYKDILRAIDAEWVRAIDAEWERVRSRMVEKEERERKMASADVSVSMVSEAMRAVTGKDVSGSALNSMLALLDSRRVMGCLSPNSGLYECDCWRRVQLSLCGAVEEVLKTGTIRCSVCTGRLAQEKKEGGPVPDHCSKSVVDWGWAYGVGGSKEPGETEQPDHDQWGELCAPEPESPAPRLCPYAQDVFPAEAKIEIPRELTVVDWPVCSDGVYDVQVESGVAVAAESRIVRWVQRSVREVPICRETGLPVSIKTYWSPYGGLFARWVCEECS